MSEYTAGSPAWSDSWAPPIVQPAASFALARSAVHLSVNRSRRCRSVGFQTDDSGLPWNVAPRAPLWLRLSGTQSLRMTDAMTALQGKHDKTVETGPIRRFIGVLGPGLITGASDDDPSGIGTYSQAGAQFGFGIGWTMLLTYPLMVGDPGNQRPPRPHHGHGIAGNLCRHYRNWLLQIIVTLLFIANAINIGADLSAMADAGSSSSEVPGSSTSRRSATICVTGIVFTSYDRYVMVLKWLTLSLFAYVATLFAGSRGLGRGALRPVRATGSLGAPTSSPHWSPSSAQRFRPTCSSGRPRRRRKM